MTPLTIYVDGTLTPANSDGAVQYDVKDMENASIIGAGNGALLDGISIQGTPHHVWIDHNEVYNSLNVDKDYYDELVSGRDEIDNVTISYRPAYSYSLVPATNAKRYVLNNAGVGKLNGCL
jgi:pectate lyase